jgi:type VI secretion system protein ImpK
MTGTARGFFLAIAAFHSESTRAVLHPGHLHRTMEDLIAGAETDARSKGLDWELFLQGKYALVALADDLALHTDWDHSETWNSYLLELRHFNTSFAGQEFFDRLARLRQQLSGVQDPTLREQVLGVMEIYYTCLQLGFRGRLRGGTPGEAEGIINSIAALLWPGGAAALRSRVCPEAYAEGGNSRIHQRGRLWWWPIPIATLLAIGVWFAFSVGQIGAVNQAIDDLGDDPVAELEDSEGDRR